MKSKIILLFLVAFATLAHASSGGALTVSFTTNSTASRNCIAIWVQNSGGAIVNNMLYNTSNGHSSAVDLTTWYGLKGWTNRTTLKNADGITGATNSSNVTKTCYWGKTVDVSTVADGTYAVKLEIIGYNGSVTGHSLATYTFTKGPAASTGVLSGAASSSFTNVSVVWSLPTGIETAELSKSYSVYPNPASSVISVKGEDVQEVELVNIAGKTISKTSSTILNISGLPRGAYLLKIKSAQGTVVKRFVKK